jgi:hypothetical protein
MTDFSTILNDKSSKPKEKTEWLSHWILENKADTSELLTFANGAKDPIKATAIESMEYASKLDPTVTSKEWFEFVVDCLGEKAPRIKWESAKVIGNSAAQFSTSLDLAITQLLQNTEHIGTVVRWSAAYALGEILLLKTVHNDTLIPAIESIILREEKNSIQKIYQKALKKITAKK